MSDTPNDVQSSRQNRQEIVTTARRMIAGELSLISGCRRLKILAVEVVDDWRDDHDFVIIGGVESETDHLPLEDQRANWDPTAFAEKQSEVARIEEVVREEVLGVCRSLIARFDGV